MDSALLSFFIFLSMVWFLVYWILGGVFFAMLAVVQFNRLRKVRFSCLFTVLSFLLGVSAAYSGMKWSQDAVGGCLRSAFTNAEKVVAVFGCGFVSIVGMFVLGALMLTVGGFLIMILCRSKTKPWIVLEPHDTDESSVDFRSSDEQGS